MGEYNVNECPTMGTLFAQQEAFQALLKGFVVKGIDSPMDMAGSILGLLGEAGEVLQADQRWKRNGRNTHYDRKNKVEEIADCFIFLINTCIYSDVTSFEIMNAIKDKIEKNVERYKKDG